MQRSDQEKFWAGTFGDDYVERNQSDALFYSKAGIFEKIFKSIGNVTSVIELGCNIGLNLRAIQRLRPEVSLSGVEINQKAVTLARKNENLEIINDSIIGFESPVCYDFVFTAGVLIHIDPKYLPEIYDTLYRLSSKYILVYEYYNPEPVVMTYRGHDNKLFKRDFAGEMLDRFPSLLLKKYGFVYHRDSDFPDDDLNWFLMEKK